MQGGSLHVRCSCNVYAHALTQWLGSPGVIRRLLTDVRQSGLTGQTLPVTLVGRVVHSTLSVILQRPGWQSWWEHSEEEVQSLTVVFCGHSLFILPKHQLLTNDDFRKSTVSKPCQSWEAFLCLYPPEPKRDVTDPTQTHGILCLGPNPTWTSVCAEFMFFLPGKLQIASVLRLKLCQVNSNPQDLKVDYVVLELRIFIFTTLMR